MSLDAPRSGAGIDIRHSVVQVNGAPMRLAEAGTGPLVVLLTASRNAGIRGDTSYPRSPKQAFMLWPRT